MPTILSHPAVALALAPWVRSCRPSIVVVAAICSLVPDADVAAFGFGIPYEHPLGHRGFTHSLCFAVIFSLFAAFAYVRLTRNDVTFRVAFWFVFVAVASHGLLDALTTGGKGVGFFIPFSNERYFFPWRPIRVSPIGAEDFLEKAGLVLRSELLFVWVPAVVIAVLGMVRRVIYPGAVRPD